MGHLSILYGHIVCPGGKDQDKQMQHNREVISKLELERDEYPWLNKEMFLIPSHDQHYYRNQLIVFGATYKSVEHDWPQWLEKFERLLNQLYWSSVTLHLETELVGDHKYEWLAETDIHTVEPAHTTNWQFNGGPRNFEDRLNHH